MEPHGSGKTDGSTFKGAVEILDFYHASEHVGTLASAIHSDDAAQAAATRSRWCHNMKQTSPATLLEETTQLLTTQLLTTHPGWSAAKQEAIQKEIHYLQSHASRTQYGYYQAQGWFIGSGVIEAGCKTVVGRRLKQSGMFWSESGAENILSLRCLILGPHFEEAWKTRHRHLTHEHSKAPRWSN